MTEVVLSGIWKSFDDVEVIKGVDLTIRSGEFVVFVGPSGCGKSTLLRLIAGLEDLTAGEVEIGGEVVTDVAPSKRGIAMVFQSYALYPHMNVFENMSFGMRLAKVGKQETKQRVQEAAEILQLTPLLDRFPKQLSGGQRQRVAIGRAIVRDPKVFLFDEPLSNLDAALRVATRIQIAKLHQSMSHTTMIYVTHDQVEAMTLADRIIVLNAGVIEQVGTPIDLYDHPTNLFVARFIGSPAMNLMPCSIDSAAPEATVTPVEGNPIIIDIPIAEEAVGSKGTLGIRPEDFEIGDEITAIVSGNVDIVEVLGEFTMVYVECGLVEPILAKLDGNVPINTGDRVHLTAPVAKLHLFDSNGQAFRRKYRTEAVA
ncbi:MAG: sn-glycerol-3-phosphate ABC transporter ATP-binding protein UgpC [Paracoccaceae bacterium]|nr:sn-glycerol-3-phosphate ABC transporter ATP-binding protein UgpC [Paracoccaceae bacterium]MDE2914436.1 sn-glycerol-3-phosphate ABC transporter ATP-binding protein UgpC [Paracoccaceae bacterium]